MSDISHIYDVIIIGAGASGLLCACKLASLGIRDILVLEKNGKPLRKLLMTGNGRCNILNHEVEYTDLNTDSPDILKIITEETDLNEVMTFFERGLGLGLVIEDDGLVYPATHMSSTVKDMILMALSEKEIPIIYGHTVKTVKKENGIFCLDGSYRSRYVVFATGGASYPETGSTGDGYRLLLPFADKSAFTEIMPSLVPLKVLEKDIRPLSGQRIKCRIKPVNGRVYEEGELLFTDYGISGICVMQISLFVLKEMKGTGKNPSVSIDLTPDTSVEDVIFNIRDRLKTFGYRGSEDALYGAFSHEMAQVLVSRYGDDPASLGRGIKDFRLTVTGSLGFERSQVTSGGLKLSGSIKLQDENIYTIGELVDVDGPCGGYNLYWAWTSAIDCAKKIASSGNNKNGK